MEHRLAPQTCCELIEVIIKRNPYTHPIGENRRHIRAVDHDSTGRHFDNGRRLRTFDPHPDEMKRIDEWAIGLPIEGKPLTMQGGKNGPPPCVAVPPRKEPSSLPAGLHSSRGCKGSDHS
jgi:hypothetical protein